MMTFLNFDKWSGTPANNSLNVSVYLLNKPTSTKIEHVNECEFHYENII